MTGGLIPRAFALAFGCILLAAMTKGLKTGRAQLVERGASRETEPAVYWIVIAVSAVAGVLLVLAAMFSSGRGALSKPEPPVVRQLAGFDSGPPRA